MSRVCMIPARIGSKRIPRKNLRYLGDIPLVAHVLKTCVNSGLFEKVYLNSDDKIFEEIANRYGAEFYLRDAKYAGDDATNEHFVQDFLTNVDCEDMIQVNPTSPFITKDDLDSVCRLLDEGNETVQSIKEEQIEGLYKNEPLNYDPTKIMPRSQDLEPVQLYSSGIMAFEKKRFLNNMEKFGAATYGGNGSLGYHVMTGFSTVDIDWEDDFTFAELVASYLSKSSAVKPKYFGEELEVTPAEFQGKRSGDTHDADRELILGMDGVKNNDMFNFNKERIHVASIIEKNGRDVSWSHTVVNSPSNSATLIAQMPGEGNRMHYHPDWDEWWYIVEGAWQWTVEGKNMEVVAGDVVFIERNRFHRIECVGDKMAIRLAVSRHDVIHSYKPIDYVAN